MSRRKWHFDINTVTTAREVALREVGHVGIIFKATTGRIHPRQRNTLWVGTATAIWTSSDDHPHSYWKFLDWMRHSNRGPLWGADRDAYTILRRQRHPDLTNTLWDLRMFLSDRVGCSNIRMIHLTTLHEARRERLGIGRGLRAGLGRLINTSTGRPLNA